MATTSPRPLGAPALDAAAVTRAEWVALGAILVLGAGLRLHALGVGLWYDEIETLVRYVQKPLAHIVTTYDSQNQHMLYSLAAHASLRLLGDSAFALRLPAALFGVASLWAVYWFGACVTSRREAILAAALLAVSYHHVWFSQNARGYTALLFWTLLGTGLMVRILEREQAGWRLVAAYAAMMALAVYTHVTALLVVAGHGLVWGALAWRAWRRGRVGAAWAPLAGFVLTGVLAAVLYAPVLPRFLGTVGTPTMAGSAVEWKQPGWFVTEMVRGLAQGVPGGLLAVAVAGAVLLVGVASYWRRSPARTALMLAPGLVTAAALIATAHNLWPRFFFFAAGFAVLIALRGGFAAIERLVPAPLAGRLATVGALLVVVASAATVPRAWGPKQDYAGAQAFVAGLQRPGDAVVVVDMTRMPCEEYLHCGWTAVSSEAELAAVEASHTRTWILYTFPTRLAAVHPGIWGRLQRDYAPAREFPGTVGGGAIVVRVRG